MNLDDLTHYANVDTADALADVEWASKQWADAQSLEVPEVDLATFSSVCVTGMGGSGITGDVIAMLAATDLSLPVVVHRGYDVPGFVGDQTLVLAISYSGNTEETVSAARAALARDATVIAISGRGELSTLVDRTIAVPSGGQPRHSLGWLLVPALRLLGLDRDIAEAVDVLEACRDAYGREVQVPDNPMKGLAQRIAGEGLELILGGPDAAGVAAYRLKCQLNENAKLSVVYGSLPESHHNEVVSWQEPDPSRGGLLLLRDHLGENDRVGRRFDITADMASEVFGYVAAIEARGTSRLARFASLMMMCDLLSVYTAIALDRDATPIPAINRIKSALVVSPREEP